LNIAPVGVIVSFQIAGFAGHLRTDRGSEAIATPEHNAAASPARAEPEQAAVRPRLPEHSIPLCLAVDSGATRASYALFRDPSRPLAAGSVDGANYSESGQEGLARLLAALAATLERLRPGSCREVEVAGLAMAGVGRPDIRRPALRDLDALRRPLFPRASFYLFHDAQSAFWAAHPQGRGVVVSAGTGSFAIGADGLGREARCGGWGRFASDEGSAYWIAIEALRRVLRSVDGREADLRLSALITGRLGLAAPLELVTWLHTPARTKEEIAALSRDVEQAAAEDDEAAASILSRAGAELADLACGVLGRLELGSPAEIALAGSVLRNSARVRASFEQSLRRVHPHVTVRLADLSSEQGTVRMLADRVARGVPPDLPAP